MRLALPLLVYRLRPFRALLAATLWRALERETGQDVAGPGAALYKVPSYKYGKVTGLYPDVLMNF